MERIEIFSSSNVYELVDAVNDFLSRNNHKIIETQFATSTMADECEYLVYSIMVRYYNDELHN